MKKITTALLVMIMVMATALPASAQFAWGLKGGLNLANNKAGDLYTQGFSNTVSVENMTGFFIGPTMEVIAPVLGLGIDASLFYSQTGTKYRLGLLNDDKTTVTDKLHYLEIPVNLKYKFNLPIVGIYVGAGPYFRYAMSGKRSWGELKGQFSNDDFYNDVDYGINLGAGVEFFSHLQIGLQYSWGLNDVAKNQIEQEGITIGTASNVARNLKNRIFSISVAYLF